MPFKPASSALKLLGGLISMVGNFCHFRAKLTQRPRQTTGLLAGTRGQDAPADQWFVRVAIHGLCAGNSRLIGNSHFLAVNLFKNLIGALIQQLLRHLFA